MILGTSKISLIIGPINGKILAPWPRIYGFSYTKIPQKILESIWDHLGKILFLHIWESKNSICSDHVCTHFLNFCNFEISKFWSFEMLKFWNLEILKFLFINWLYSLEIVLWRWGSENDWFSINKNHKNLDMIFISIKSHEQETTLNFLFSRKVT